MNINQYDCECSKAELDLFTTPPLNTSMEKGAFVAYHPISSLTDNGPIEFHIPGPAEEYIDLGRTRLYVKAKITEPNGDELKDGEKVAPTNLFLHSLFSQVDLKLRDTLITPSVNTYPYKSYLETLLTYGADAKESQLTSELWWSDHGNMDEVDPYKEDIDNLGLKKRALFTANSGSVELMGRLHCDIFQQDRYLINNVDMSLKLIRSPVAFHLIGESAKYKTVIEEATLYVRRVKLNPSIALEHSKMLDQGKMIKYPIRRSLVTTFTIPGNSLSFNKENVISGQLPRRLVVGFVKNAAFNGSVKMNPYNFQHFQLNYLTISNGSQIVPSQPLTPNFDKNEYLAAYMTLFEGTGLLHADRGHCIKRDEYAKGYALYVFDLTADMCEGAHIDPIKYGNLRMEAHFAHALPCPVNAVVYAEYDNIIQVDRARNIITDFASS
jgi:hypothetical protein